MQRLSGLPTELALMQAAPFLVHLVENPGFSKVRFAPSWKKREAP
jgi:hypothetical protein